MDFRFTLSHSSGSVEITEPEGWKNSKIVLERHKEFYSLIERYEGSAGDAFIFYGDNHVVNGGIDFIKDIEREFGFDANIEITVDFSDDDTVLEEIYSGLLDIPGKTAMVDNKVKIPVIRDDFWTKFINRMDTPVDLTSTTDLDGNAISPVTPVTINLTSQLLRQEYEGHHNRDVTVIYDIPDSQYGQIDFEETILDEIEEKYNYPLVENAERPFELFAVEYAGDYLFDIHIFTATGVIFGSGTDPNLEVRLQVNDDAAIVLTQSGGSSGLESWIEHNYNNTIALQKGDFVRLYFYNNNATGPSYQFVLLANLFHDTRLLVTANTTFPESEGQGYLLHDAFHGVLERYGLGTSPFYSELLGSQLTNERTYASNGCGWGYVIMKGLQVKGLTLAEKPFFTSFKHLWGGADPILGLGLGYELINGIQTVVIEEKEEWFESDVSVSFNNVRDIESGYDKDHIFKTIKTGFKDWGSENISGIDDVQTKHTYATRFIKTGIDLDLESEFMAASLAIESCRRASKQKSKDYKHDDKTFIIAIVDDDVSPDRYRPELDENFDSITGLFNSSTRYNSILTPLRSLLRNANLIGGCLQSYTDSAYKFVSGEGNYDAVFDYSCAAGNQCQAVICDSLAENVDLPLGAPSNYNTLFGFLFYPMLYKIKLPMSWDDFKTIRDAAKKPIGISQTDSGHYRFYIKELSYDMTIGQAEILAWPKGRVGSTTFDPSDLFPDIVVIDPPYVPVTGEGPIERSEQDSDDDATGVITNPSSGDGEGEETFFRILEDGDIRKTEDGDYRILEDGAVLASNRYFNEGSGLYFYQDSEIPPANEITFFEENEF